MSQENVDLVRAMNDPFDGTNVAEVDWEGEAIRELLERLFSPDVELTTLESAVGVGPSRTYRGWDGLVSYLKEWYEPFSEHRQGALDYVDAADRVLVPIRAWGIHAGSGVRAELELTLPTSSVTD
jgi:hypothetical protein